MQIIWGKSGNKNAIWIKIVLCEYYTYLCKIIIILII